MKKSTIFLLILLAVFFTSTLYLLYLNFNKASTKVTSTFTPTTGIITTDTVSPTTIPTVNPTADWKTYTNSKLGFSLKYPKSWQTINENSSSIDIIGFSHQSNSLNSDIYLGYFDNPKNMSIPDFYEDYTSHSDMVISNPFTQVNIPEQINISGKTGYRFVEGGAIADEVVVIELVDGKILKIQRHIYENSTENYKDVYDQILSTFKFL